jgi:hypothetical protein
MSYCVCLRIMMSKTSCVVCIRVVSCVPNVASFSGLSSILDCLFSFSNVYWKTFMFALPYQYFVKLLGYQWKRIVLLPLLICFYIAIKISCRGKINAHSNGLNVWNIYLMKLDWDIFFRTRLDISTRIWLSKF